MKADSTLNYKKWRKLSSLYIKIERPEETLMIMFNKGYSRFSFLNTRSSLKLQNSVSPLFWTFHFSRERSSPSRNYSHPQDSSDTRFLITIYNVLIMEKRHTKSRRWNDFWACPFQPEVKNYVRHRIRTKERLTCSHRFEPKWLRTPSCWRNLGMP